VAAAEALGAVSATMTTGTAAGVTAHQSPTEMNSAAPSAGSHIGVRGSSSSVAAWESLMTHGFYHTHDPRVRPKPARS
jgi:hypothetical protein